MRATWSQVLRTSGRTPDPSLPRTSAVGTVRSTSPISFSPSAARPGIGGGLSHPVRAARFPSFVAALKQHADDVLGVRLERLEHRVDAVDEPAHCTSTAIANSRFCFSHSLSVQMKKLSVPFTSS